MSDRPALDKLLLSELRLSIMAYLLQNDSMTFNELLAKTDATRGNLSVQLKKLSDARYIKTTRTIRKSYTETNCEIEEIGRKALINYLKEIKKIIEKKT